ncbi:putative insulin-1 [Trichinella spiralis]|uniref:putative insulin-1 n=1 Tax=Trichinella spiralis TaxID=6334 RepID=UPI0001EFBF96|nr:putative insulin-1 [Trichinella spiralis]
MGCFEIPRAKCQSMLVVSKKKKNAQLPGTNLTKQEKLEPKRWSEKCCHSSLEIWMTFRGKCGGKKVISYWIRCRCKLFEIETFELFEHEQQAKMNGDYL